MRKNNDEIIQELHNEIKNLCDALWEGRIKKRQIDDWLSNFADPQCSLPPEDQKRHALFLLSNFIYFGNEQIRALLRSLYRDCFRTPIVQEIRKRNGDTLDPNRIEPEFNKELEATRFFGIGNPSESGTHLLYYFRQENKLSKKHFMRTHKIFERNTNRASTSNLNYILRGGIKRYVFIDDFCGSGQQGEDYSHEIVSEIKNQDPNAEVLYFILFGTEDGIQILKKNTCFDRIQCVVELDNTFKCFSDSSRYFINASEEYNISKKDSQELCTFYGKTLRAQIPLGYGDCQLLLGFHHNTPDNSLPIFWADEGAWKPIFKRYDKIYP